MRVTQSLSRRIKSLLSKESKNAELSDELQFHLEREIEQNVADGMSPEDAKTAARASFGSVPEITEECYRARGTAWIEDFQQDVRYGLRNMMKHRSFSVVTILTLALGIGACTAVFSLMDAVLFRSLPYGNAEQLVYLYTPSVELLRVGVPASVFNPSYADFQDFKKRSKSFSATTMFQTTAFNFSEGDQLERVGAAAVDSKYVLLAGLSGLIASALSMGSGAYLAAKSEREIYQAEVGREREAIQMNGPEARELLSLYYQVKGLPEADAMHMVNHIASDPDQLLRPLASERLGHSEEALSNPTVSALSGALSTAVGASIPVIPFFFLNGIEAVIVAAIVSLAAHFAVGAAKSLITVRSWWSSGFEMTVVGALEGAVTYGIGILLGKGGM